MMVLDDVNTGPEGRPYGWRLVVGCLFLMLVLVPVVHADKDKGDGNKYYEPHGLGVISPDYPYHFPISKQWVKNDNTVVYYRFTFSIDDPGSITINSRLASGSTMNPKGELHLTDKKKITDHNGGFGHNFLIKTCLNRVGTYTLDISGPHSSDFELMIFLSPPGDGCGSDGEDSSISCMDISDAPLTTRIKSPPPLIMFLLDDSGSMDSDILCDSDGGDFRYGDGGLSGYISGDANFNGEVPWANDVRKYWVTQWSGYNRLYYNPEVIYTPWPIYANANPENTKKHPAFDYGSHDMDSDNFVTFSWGANQQIKLALSYAHYYVKSRDDLYLVNLDDGTARYYSVDAYGEAGDYALQSFTELSIPPDSIRIKDYGAALQNMANWYQYSRNRELAAKSALAQVINGLSGVKVGLYAINNKKVSGVLPVHVDGHDETGTLLEKLYDVKVNFKGGTPLRQAFYNVGTYFDATDGKQGGIGKSPYASDSEGGTCQQAFTIVMTDGYYNGDFNKGVGNTDKNSTVSQWDGPPYADTYSDTLSDIAMYFYERDLSSDLDDHVPTNAVDTADHQHMVTYTLAFGVKGTLTPETYDCPSHCPGGTGAPAWPDPDPPKPHWNKPKPDSDAEKIDDLFHAAVNGRGKFFSVGDSQALAAALTDMVADIQDRVMTSASVALNSQALNTDSALYQGYFDSSNWSGELTAFSLGRDEAGEVTPSKVWSAQDLFQGKSSDWWRTGRKVLTYDVDGSGGVDFLYANLTDSQKALLPEAVLNYVRGDSSQEVAHGGRFRDRDGRLLGDIVHSSPVYEAGVVYVGANDGMLHAFDASDGNELFAYVPSFVIKNLFLLADPDYSHAYYVDNTVHTRVVTNGSVSTTWLVGGLGKGGKGFYGIDITDPKAISGGTISKVWEYPKLDTSDPDMGYSYSEPVIVTANTGESVVLCGNGYDSTNASAVLYILDMDGALIQKIDTGVGNPDPLEGQCNGLSTPVPIDRDYDGTVDVVYAGDLLGNMWKFDLSGKTKGDWQVAYGGAPLFTAQSKGGGIQPIVSKPAVMTHCDGSRKGPILIFGTGRYMAYEDTISDGGQSIYGIWDWADEWEASASKSLGLFQEATDSSERSLSNATGMTLLKQEVTVELDALIKSTTHTIHWFSPSAKEKGETTGHHLGWYMDLPGDGERVVTRVKLIDGVAVGVSLTPQSSPCSSGGDSVVYMLDACNGGQYDDELFDSDEDGDVDAADGTFSGKRYRDNIYYAPAIINADKKDADKLFFDAKERMEVKKEILGIFYWRFVE